jgi:hypothetical protein
VQRLEYDYLAPDSVQEMMDAIFYLRIATAGQFGDVYVHDVEHAKRKTLIRKPHRAIELFTDMINYYLVRCLIEWDVTSADVIPTPKAHTWTNLGGQLVTNRQLEVLLKAIEKGTIKSWDQVHAQYLTFDANYNQHKLEHALVCYCLVYDKTMTTIDWAGCIHQAIKTSGWMANQIVKSKEKDFINPFRRMMYNSQEEMDEVLGTLDSIPFLKTAHQDHLSFVKACRRRLKRIYS